MTTEKQTGWVACNYTEGDKLSDVRRGTICKSVQEADEEANAAGFDGVRYVHTDGYLYYNPPPAS